MATKKRPPAVESGSHPEPRRGAKPSAPGRSLREQVKALVPRVATAPPSAAQAPAPPKLQPAASDALSFKELAAGVRPLPERAKPAILPGPRAAPVTRVVAPKTRLWVERQDGSVRARASDVPARLLDDLQAGRVLPRHQLDLHRKSAVEARQALDVGVRQARRDKLGCLLVVCGRGIHSGLDGPVLPDVAIEQLSEELADEILAFCTAPRKWGGEGALLVRLRAPASSSH